MSELQKRIEEDLRGALKARQEQKLSTLRLIKSDLQYEMSKTGAKSLTDEQVTSVLQRAAKKRKESIQQFRQAGREESALGEEAELAIIQEYLPREVAEETILAAIEEIFAELKPSAPSDMGKVMSAVMGRFKGQNINGAIVKELVQKRLKS